MTLFPRLLGLCALSLVLSGCGGNTNSLPSDVGTPEYAQKTGEMMKNTYGLPKPETATSNNPADMMRKTYGR